MAAAATEADVAAALAHVRLGYDRTSAPVFKSCAWLQTYKACDGAKYETTCGGMRSGSALLMTQLAKAGLHPVRFHSTGRVHWIKLDSIGRFTFMDGTPVPFSSDPGAADPARNEDGPAAKTLFRSL